MFINLNTFIYHVRSLYLAGLDKNLHVHGYQWKTKKKKKKAALRRMVSGSLNLWLSYSIFFYAVPYMTWVLWPHWLVFRTLCFNMAYTTMIWAWCLPLEWKVESYEHTINNDISSFIAASRFFVVSIGHPYLNEFMLHSNYLYFTSGVVLCSVESINLF